MYNDHALFIQFLLLLVDQVLQEYKDNALILASKANINLHMELPKLSAEDDGIEKAGLEGGLRAAETPAVPRPHAGVGDFPRPRHTRRLPTERPLT